MERSRILLGAVILGMGVGLTTPFAAARSSDGDLTEWVQSALRQDPHVDPAGIDVQAENGIVTLGGYVRNLASKERAFDDAKKIDGVLGVVDELAVSAPLRPDADISLDVLNRIIHNQLIESRNIDVTCEEGRVLLSGTVGSWAEVQEAGVLAAEVRGVQAVRNMLSVQYVGSRSDDEIRKDAQAKLDLDVYLSGLPITPTVKDGVVTLVGSVGSQFEKDRAEREVRYLAYVKNVRNDLKVERWENRGARIAAPAPVTDKELIRHVKAAIDMDSRVMPSKLDVEAASGHVTLSGAVAYGYQKRLAEEDARNTIGTAWVTNDLLVTGVYREDASLRADILSSLDSDYMLHGMDITVRVKNGVVTLGGNVNNKAEQAHAAEVVTHIIGVKEIRNQVKLERDPYSDATLTREVRDRLLHDWLTAGVAHYINVTATEGSVLLTGEVNTWGERSEATRVALNTAGVLDVHNKLSVRGAGYPWDEWDETTTFFSPYYWVWY